MKKNNINRKMRIAFVSDSIYPYNKGGKETRSYDLAKKLVERGHEVHFYTMKYWEGEDVIKRKGFYLHGICREVPLYKNNRRNIWQGICFGLSCFKLIKEDFDVLDADHMVYFHLFPCKLACLLKKKKLVVTWHEVWGLKYWLKYLGWKGIFGGLIEKLSSKLPDKIISISKHTTKNLIDLNVKKEEIFTIDNGVDISKIRKIKAGKERSDVVFAGRLIKHKNVDVLIKAIKEIKGKNPNIKCLILGDGPEKEKLKNLVKELGLEKNVIFKGFLKNLDDVYSLMKSSKVFVLPSEREGFGIVVIEANACGIPVVTINHKDNASKDLIQDGHKNLRTGGFVCELNEKDLAKNIFKALEKKNWKKDCLEFSKNYDWGKIIEKFEEVYR